MNKQDLARRVKAFSALPSLPDVAAEWDREGVVVAQRPTGRQAFAYDPYGDPSAALHAAGCPNGTETSVGGLGGLMAGRPHGPMLDATQHGRRIKTSGWGGAAKPLRRYFNTYLQKFHPTAPLPSATMGGGLDFSQAEMDGAYGTAGHGVTRYGPSTFIQLRPDKGIATHTLGHELGHAVANQYERLNPGAGGARRFAAAFPLPSTVTPYGLRADARAMQENRSFKRYLAGRPLLRRHEVPDVVPRTSAAQHLLQRGNRRVLKDARDVYNARAWNGEELRVDELGRQFAEYAKANKPKLVARLEREALKSNGRLYAKELDAAEQGLRRLGFLYTRDAAALANAGTSPAQRTLTLARKYGLPNIDRLNQLAYALRVSGTKTAGARSAISRFVQSARSFARAKNCLTGACKIQDELAKRGIPTSKAVVPYPGVHFIVEAPGGKALHYTTARRAPEVRGTPGFERLPDRGGRWKPPVQLGGDGHLLMHRGETVV